jgi:hypothetical protein
VEHLEGAHRRRFFECEPHGTPIPFRSGQALVEARPRRIRA